MSGILTSSPLRDRTQAVIDQLLKNLGKCNEAKKQLSSEVSYLTSRVDELSSDLIKCKIQIGTLEASNENLQARVAANHNAADIVASLRKQISDNEIQKQQLLTTVKELKKELRILHNEHASLQQLQEPSLEKSISSTNSDMPSIAVDLKNVKINELKTALDNLKRGFQIRETQLQSQLSQHKTGYNSKHASQLRTRDTLRDVTEGLCNMLDAIESNEANEVNRLSDGINSCMRAMDDSLALECILALTQHVPSNLRASLQPLLESANVNSSILVQQIRDIAVAYSETPNIRPDAFADIISDLQSQIADLSSTVTAVSHERDTLSEECTRQSTRTVELEAMLLALEEQWTEQTSAVDAEFEQYKQQIEALEMQLQRDRKVDNDPHSECQTAEEIAQLRQQLSDLQEQHHEHDLELEHAVEVAVKWEMECSTLQQQVLQLQLALEEKDTTAINTITELLQQVEALKATREEENIAWEKKVDDINADIEHYEEQLRLLETHVQEERQENSLMTEKYQSLYREFNDIATKHAAATDEIALLQQQLSDLQEQHHEHDQELEHAVEVAVKWEMECSTLQQQIEALAATHTEEKNKWQEEYSILADQYQRSMGNEREVIALQEQSSVLSDEWSAKYAAVVEDRDVWMNRCEALNDKYSALDKEYVSAVGSINEMQLSHVEQCSAWDDKYAKLNTAYVTLQNKLIEEHASYEQQIEEWQIKCTSLQQQLEAMTMMYSELEQLHAGCGAADDLTPVLELRPLNPSLSKSADAYEESYSQNCGEEHIKTNGATKSYDRDMAARCEELEQLVQETAHALKEKDVCITSLESQYKLLTGEYEEVTKQLAYLKSDCDGLIQQNKELIQAIDRHVYGDTSSSSSGWWDVNDDNESEHEEVERDVRNVVNMLQQHGDAIAQQKLLSNNRIEALLLQIDEFTTTKSNSDKMISHLEEKCEQLSHEVELLQKCHLCDEYCSKIEILEDKLEEERTSAALKVEMLTAELHTLEQSSEAMVNQLSALIEEKAQMEQSLEDAHQTVTRLNQESVGTAAEHVVTLEAQSMELRQVLSETYAAVKDKDNKIQELEQVMRLMKDEHTQSINAVHNDLQARESSLNEAQSCITELRSELEAAYDAIKELDDRVAHLSAAAQEVEGQNASLNVRIAEYDHIVESLRHENLSMSTELHAKADEQVNAKDRIASLIDQVNMIQQSCDDLAVEKSRVAELQHQQDEIQAVLKEAYTDAASRDERIAYLEASLATSMDTCEENAAKYEKIITELQSEASEHIQTIEQKQLELNQLSESTAHAIEQWMNKIHELEITSESMVQQISDLQLEKQRLESSLAKTRQELDEVTDELVATRSDLRLLEESQVEHGEHARRVAELEHQLEEVQGVLQEASTELTEKSNLVESVTQEYVTLQRERDALQREIDEITSSLVEKERDCISLNQKLFELEQANISATTTMENLHLRVEQMETSSEYLVQQISDLQLEKQRLENSLAKTRQELDEVTDELVATRSDLRLLEESQVEHGEHARRVAELEHQLEEVQGVLQEASTELTEKSNLVEEMKHAAAMITKQHSELVSSVVNYISTQSDFILDNANVDVVPRIILILRELSEKRVQGRADLEILQLEKDETAASLSNKQQECVSLHEKIAELEQAIEHTQEHFNVERSVVQALETRASQLERDAVEQLTTIESLTDKLHSVEQELQDTKVSAAATMENLHLRGEQMEMASESMVQQISDLQLEKQRLESSLAKTRQELDEVTDELVATRSDLRLLEESQVEHGEHARRVAELEYQLEEVQGVLQEASTDLANRSSRIEELESCLEASRVEAQSIRQKYCSMMTEQEMISELATAVRSLMTKCGADEEDVSLCDTNQLIEALEDIALSYKVQRKTVAEVPSLREQIEMLTRQKQELHDAKGELLERCTKLEAKLISFRENELSEQSNAADTETGEPLQDKLHSLTSEVESLRTMNNRLAEQISLVEKEKTSALSQLGSKQQEVVALVDEMNTYHESLNEKDLELQQLNLTLASTQAQLALVRGSSLQHEQLLDSLRQENGELLTKLSATNFATTEHGAEDQANLQRVISDLQQQIKIKDDRFVDMEYELQQRKDEVTTLTAASSTLSTKFTLLQQEYNELAAKQNSSVSDQHDSKSQYSDIVDEVAEGVQLLAVLLRLLQKLSREINIYDGAKCTVDALPEIESMSLRDILEHIVSSVDIMYRNLKAVETSRSLRLKKVIHYLELELDCKHDDDGVDASAVAELCKQYIGDDTSSSAVDDSVVEQLNSTIADLRLSLQNALAQAEGNKTLITMLERERNQLQEEIDITRIEVELLNKRLDDSEIERRELQEKITDMKAGKSGPVDANQAQEQLKHYRDKYHDTASALLELEESYNVLKSDMEKEISDRQALQSKYADLENISKALIRQQEQKGVLNENGDATDPDAVWELEQQLAATEEERDALREEAAEKQAEIDALLSELEETRNAGDRGVLLQRIEELELERDNYKDMMLKAFESANTESSKGGGMISGLMGSNKQTLEKMAALKRQVAELKPLEKLRPQLMELQHQLEQTQLRAAEEIKAKNDEIHTLSEHNHQLADAIVSVKGELESVVAECEALKEDINISQARVAELEESERRLNVDLEDARAEIDHLVETSADPAVIAELEQKLEELQNERKHWQRKATSLSKDLQKLMSNGTDLVQLREENLSLAAKVEELMAERTAFREAMQQTMEEASPARAMMKPKLPVLLGRRKNANNN